MGRHEPKYPLSIRVPLSVHAKYRELSPIAKEYFRLMIVKILEEGKLTQLNELSVLNMNLNINVNKNEVNPVFNNTNIQGDSELTKEYIQSLKAELAMAKEVIKKKNNELRKLRTLIDKLRTLAKHNDIYSIRKILSSVD